MTLIEKLEDEFGSPNAWAWNHFGDCPDCRFESDYDSTFVVWCWVVEGRYHKYPQTWDDYLTEAYSDNARWHNDRMFRAVYEMHVANQLRDEMVVFKRFKDLGRQEPRTPND